MKNNFTEKEKEVARKVVNELSDYVNYRRSTDAFISEFKNDHRTLQQSMFRLMLNIIHEIADDSYQTDGRNEDSKIIAKLIVNGFKQQKKLELINNGFSEKNASDMTENFKMSDYLRYV